MKRRFLLLLLAVGFSALSCQRTELVDDTRSVAALEFNPSVAGSVGSAMGSAVGSKAATDVVFGTYGFSIAGYHTQGKMAAALAVDKEAVYPNVFDYSPTDGQVSVPLVKKNNENKYVLSTVKWSLDETSYLSYYAWAQNKVKDDASGVVGEYASKTKYGAPVLSIVNASLAADQVDIVAARYEDQPNNIVVSAVDLDFEHILAKLTFKLKSSVGAEVSLSKVDLAYGADAVHSKATYELMTEKMVGLQAFHTGLNSYGAKTITKGAEVVAGELLLIPQVVKKGFVNFALTYTITSGSGSIDQTKVVDLPAGTLVGGVNHAYTIDIRADGIEVSNPLVLDWISDPVDRLPLIAGPRGDVMLLLDGYEPPYQHSDGKWYWLDKSGYNRHCEIMDYAAAMYNAKEASYTFNGTVARYLKVPSLGAVTDLSTDIVTENATTTEAGNVIISFNSADGGSVVKYQFQASWRGNSNVYFDNGAIASGRVEFVNGTMAEFQKRTMWSVQRQDAGVMNIYKNANLVATKNNTGASKLGTLDVNTIGSSFVGKLFYVKVTKRVTGSHEVVADFKKLKPRYAIAGDVVDSYIRSGLVGWYDGYNSPEYIGGKRVWRDKSPQANHGEIKGAVWEDETSAYNMLGGPIALVNSDIRYMWTAASGMTIEFVWRRHNPHGDFGMFTAAGDGTTLGNAHGFMLFSWKPGDGTPESGGAKYMQWEDYAGTNIKDIVWGASSMEEDVQNLSSWGYSKVSPTSSVLNNIGYKNGKATGVTGGHIRKPFTATKNFVMNGASYRLYAVRIYNRVLTQAEVTNNYEMDKKYYGLKF